MCESHTCSNVRLTHLEARVETTVRDVCERKRDGNGIYSLKTSGGHIFMLQRQRVTALWLTLAGVATRSRASRAAFTRGVYIDEAYFASTTFDPLAPRVAQSFLNSQLQLS